jgi:hypothetical protein
VGYHALAELVAAAITQEAAPPKWSPQKIN